MGTCWRIRRGLHLRPAVVVAAAGGTDSVTVLWTDGRTDSRSGRALRSGREIGRPGTTPSGLLRLVLLSERDSVWKTALSRWLADHWPQRGSDPAEARVLAHAALGAGRHDLIDQPALTDLERRWLATRAAADFQEQIGVTVIEGDPDHGVDDGENVVLIEFQVPLDPPRPRDQAGFDLTFRYDTDGLLHVDVTDMATGRPMTDQVTISFTGARDPRELVSMADRVRSSVDDDAPLSGVDAGPSDGPSDPRAMELITRARSKVLPFLDGEAAAEVERRLSELIDASGDAVTGACDELERELRKHAYLW